MLTDNLASRHSITFTAEWRQPFQQRAAQQFVNWCQAGIERVLTHHSDPSWDSSGSLRTTRCDPLLLRVRHEFLHEWAHAEYTGNSLATYVSGAGLAWETYAEALESTCQDVVHERVKAYFVNALNLDLSDDTDYRLWSDTIMDDGEMLMRIDMLCRSLRDEALQMTTQAAWTQYSHV